MADAVAAIAAYDASHDVLYEGDLEKRGQVIRNWRPRYVVLWRNGLRLQYFARDATGQWAAKGVIPVSSIQSCKAASAHCVFKLATPTGTLYFRAKSQSVCDTWMRAIETCMAPTLRDATVLATLKAFDEGVATRMRRFSIAYALAQSGQGYRTSVPSTTGGDGARKPSITRGGSTRRAAVVLPSQSEADVTSRSHGTLYLKVVRAAGLLGKDRSGLSDPYCRVHIDGYEVTTAVVEKSNDPCWNQEFELPFNRSIRHCTLMLFDSDLSKDDFLGRCVLPLSHVTSEPVMMWMDVGKRSHKSHVAGRLCVQLRTDVGVDDSLMTVLAGLRALPSLLMPLSASRSLALPPESVEEIVDCAPVNMYPYPPVAAPTYLDKYIPGLLILTNFRLVFVVKDHLRTGTLDAPVDTADDTAASTSATSEHEETRASVSETVPSVDSSYVDVGLPSSDSDEDVDADNDTATRSEDEGPVTTGSSLRPDGPPTFPGEIHTAFVDNGRPSIPDPQYYFQVPLGAIVGAAKFDVRSGVVSCGSLEATAAPGSSSSFEVFQGSPVVQIDGDHFQTPTFVFIDAVAGQGVQHCTRLYDFIGHTVINRHLELGRIQSLWRRHHISLRYPPLVSLDTPPGVVSNEFGYDPVPILSDEFKRQGVPNRFWRLSSVNRDYHVCDSYPPVIGVPHGVTDADVTAAAAFRSKNRMPALTWIHPLNQASITRCSQPMVGLIGHRNSHDELLLEAIRNASRDPAQLLLIVDVRPKLNAVANQTQGKGYETVGPGTNYPNVCLHFMNVHNIHVMRKSLETLRKSLVVIPEEDVVDTQQAFVEADEDDGIPRAVSEAPREGTWGKLTGLLWKSPSQEGGGPEGGGMSTLAFTGVGDDSGWLTAVAESGWLVHCSSVLCAASRVATVINRDAISVLVHCSDGWDRTAQVCALAQILLDPYYRTIDGFAVLVEKDWVAFGHKFADRLGFDGVQGYQSGERSPIFLQFLDCVRLIWEQHGTRFEFNEAYLSFLADAVSTGWFHTFVRNTVRERVEDCSKDATSMLPSVWLTIHSRRHEFLNASYLPPPEPALRPVPVDGTATLHREWHSNLVLPVNHSVRTLSLWMSRLTEWQTTATRLQVACPAQSAEASMTHILSVRSSRGIGGSSSEVASRKAGHHGGLTLGLSLGPKGGASHCAECKCEFLRIVRGRRHCRVCLRSVCRGCSMKLEAADAARQGYVKSVAGMPAKIRVCVACQRERKMVTNPLRSHGYFFMRPSRKSASRGVFLLPAPETPQKQPVSMYWVDDCGRMWYSGSKPAPNRSQLSASSQNDENVPPSPQSGGSFPLKLQDTNVVQGRKSLKRSRRTNSFCAPTQAYDTARCTFNDGLLLEDQQPVGVEIHAEHVMDDPLVSKAMVRQTAPLILFLVAIVAIDATVTSLGWSHILRSNQIGTLAVAAPQTPPLLTIHSTERDVLSNKVDITVDVAAHVGSGKYGNICGTARSDVGDYAFACIPTVPSRHLRVVFHVTGLTTKEYAFTVVAWDVHGHKFAVQANIQPNFVAIAGLQRLMVAGEQTA